MPLESRLIPGPRHKGNIPEVRSVLSDVDNTILPNGSLALTTPRVTKAFRAASETVPTGLATARQPQKANYLIDHLRLSGKSILSNGAQIYEGSERLIVVERSLPVDTTMEVARNLQRHNIDHWIQDDGVDHRWVRGSQTPRRERQIKQGLGTYKRPVDITHPEKGEVKVEGYTPQKPFIIVAHQVSYEDSSNITDMVNGYAHQGVTSFVGHENTKTDGSKTFEVFITHKLTNKKDAMLTVAEMQKISVEEFLGIGDGPNDKVLVETAGIGVAMGNAIEETKAVAVYIAPTREDDGAAIAIEKLVR